MRTAFGKYDKEARQLLREMGEEYEDLRHIAVVRRALINAHRSGMRKRGQMFHRMFHGKLNDVQTQDRASHAESNQSPEMAWGDTAAVLADRYSL